MPRTYRYRLRLGPIRRRERQARLADLTLSKTSLTFTAADWAEAQTVTVSAGQDDDAVDDTVVLRHGATGGDYAGVQGPAVTVTVQDDDTAGVSVSRTGLTIPEGESGHYTVVLTSKPTAAVAVTVGGHAGSDLTLSKTSLTFTAADWAEAQTVTVSAGQDDDAVDDTVVLRHGATGGDYAGVQGRGGDGDGAGRRHGGGIGIANGVDHSGRGERALHGGADEQADGGGDGVGGRFHAGTDI